MVLILALPPESPFWRSYQAAQERAMKPTPEQIRERARYYEERAKEAASDG